MGWIVAIVCIILIVIFWRIFLPIAVLAAAALGVFLLYAKVDSDKRERERERAQQEVRDKLARAQIEVRERIAKAKATAGDVGREWAVSTETDPASGQKVPRYASVLSDDGLCKLQVEQRMNATRLAGIYCPGLKISTGSDIEAKFDNQPTSDRMRIEKFSDSEQVYIPSSQPTYSKHLPYNQFLQRMTGANKVALLLTVEGAGQHWFTFSLGGSRPALAAIGALTSGEGGAQKSVQKKPSSTQRKSTGGAVPGLPANARLNVYGNDWECVRGYRRSGNECVAVQVPQYATLNVYGNDWQCIRGYRRRGTECVAVVVPPNATLNVYGNDWQCQRGYRRSGKECVAVQIPPNATLNVYGNGWQCVRGYRQSGSECVPVGVSSPN